MDKKQINEMAKIICKSCLDSMDSVYDCNASEKPCKGATDKAQALYNAGYRKVGEGDIIITEDENFENLKHTAECVRELKTKIHKETAKEFGNFILALFPFDKNFTTISRATIKAKLKEYGVEIDNAE